jgi:hypothetical protein
MTGFNGVTGNSVTLIGELIEAFKIADNWLIEKHLKDFANHNMSDAINECLVKACDYNNTTIIKTILNNEILSKHIDFNYRDNEALDIVCRNCNVELAKFLLTSSELKMHPPVSESVLYTCFGNQENEKLMRISNFLIFNLKIKRTPSVVQVLKNYPNEQVTKWFELRHLAKSLDKELNHSTTTENSKANKKIKL